MLEARDLYKTYKSGAKPLHVLKGINLSLERGKTTAIVGPSGAGKSTLMHLLGGLDRPTKGKVFLDGEDLYSLKDSKRAEIRNRRIGFVFQFYHLLPEFTVLENVAFPAFVGGIKRRIAINSARALVNAVGLSNRAGHRPGELSGGEMQRAAIARALINDPEVILCDEPTGNLDSRTGQSVIDLLLDLNKKKNKTIVIVTHEEKIASVAHRKCHIQDGQLV
ncbi:MAG: ABC transporter ATP-binding protein [Candidatus Omnitrophica bacterium]|nr:ABC transporter ATP-binding protein [Candidatus Omnitrophota bacterium]